jgi:hypothetical protein
VQLAGRVSRSYDWIVGETIDPPRNFTIPLEERVRALGGPPAYIRRERAIEDLEEGLLARVRGLLESGLVRVDRSDVVRDLAQLNDLIDRHNRYYPAEANLPSDPRTSRMLERVGGRPWEPLLAWSIERLLAEAGVRV